MATIDIIIIIIIIIFKSINQSTRGQSSQCSPCTRAAMVNCLLN